MSGIKLGENGAGSLLFFFPFFPVSHTQKGNIMSLMIERDFSRGYTRNTNKKEVKKKEKEREREREREEREKMAKKIN